MSDCLTDDPSFEELIACCNEISHYVTFDNQLRRTIFFDLDNTLIPTDFIGLKYSELMKLELTIEGMRKRLSTLLESNKHEQLLRSLFHTCKRQGFRHICIVTNAAAHTVEYIYLKLCYPGLSAIFDKYCVELRCTDGLIQKSGLNPQFLDSKMFADLYTEVKFLQFCKSIVKREYSEKKLSLPKFQNKQCVCSSTVKNELPDTSLRENYEIISVGDQLCELEAALRLSHHFGERIKNIKLLYLSDVRGIEDEAQSPRSFSIILNRIKSYLLNPPLEKDVWCEYQPGLYSISINSKLSSCRTKKSSDGSIEFFLEAYENSPV